MSKTPLVPGAQNQLDKMKMEVADELGVSPKANPENDYPGNMSTNKAGAMAGYKNVGNVGGEMVKRMIMQAENKSAEREKNGK